MNTLRYKLTTITTDNTAVIIGLRNYIGVRHRATELPLIRTAYANGRHCTYIYTTSLIAIRMIVEEIRHIYRSYYETNGDTYSITEREDTGKLTIIDRGGLGYGAN